MPSAVGPRVAAEGAGRYRHELARANTGMAGCVLRDIQRSLTENLVNELHDEDLRTGFEREGDLNESDVPDPARAARRRCSWLAGGMVVLVAAAVPSLPGFYNDLFGPFVLSGDKLRNATELKELGWERYVEADFGSFEDTGWYQFLRTEETFTRVEVSTPPEKYYLIGTLGTTLVAVESNSRDTGPRRVVGTLHEVPPKLRKMLEQNSSEAVVPRFFLQEGLRGGAWVVELLFGVVLGLWLVWSFGKSLLALKHARRVNVVRPSTSAGRWGPN